MKRRDFAKMRKALLEDERIGKIAENPKRAAFLRAIEDRGSDDEMDWLDDTVVGVDEAVGGSQALSREDSQQEGEVLVVPDSQGESGEVMGPPKRKAGVEHTARLPPNLRRTAAPESKRPSSLSEVRASLSSLIEDPNTIVVPNDSESESEAEHNDDNDDEIDGLDVTKGKSKGKENFDPFARRNTTKVVDRISLAHNRSSSSNTNSASTRLAFAVSSAASSFKVPALLRRATTNSSITSSGSSSGGAGKNSVGGNGGGGAKRGSVGGVRFFEREEQKMKSVVEGQKKREEKLLKGVEARRRNVGGLFGKGKFE
jgi:mediator of replication checkpoint protein 1